MITKGKNRVPITGSSRVPARRKFVLGNQAQTSSTLQRQVRLPDTPQQDSQLRVGAPTHPAYRVGADFAKATLEKRSSFSIHNRPTVNLGAVGEPRLPRGYNSINSGFPQTGRQRVVGGGNQPSAQKSAMPKLKPGQAKNYPSLMGGYRP